MTAPASPDDTRTPWHTRDVATSAQALDTHPSHGLDAAEAQRRLEQHGPNRLIDTGRRSLLAMIATQFADLLILILIVAAIISGILGEWTDAIAILVIVMLNATVGVIQEYRAEHALAALRRMATPEARVVRAGEIRHVPSDQLVPGDVVVLETGAVVPADLRLTATHNLEVDEAALTGESVTVAKHSEAIGEQDLPLGDRLNMAYKGTQITRGRAHGLVVDTGMRTEIGRIAHLLAEHRESRTPLQLRLDRFGRRLALVVLAVCTILFVAGILRDEPAMLMFLTAVSLAVAAIPEALPAVVTMSLAIGARKMSHQFALVRNLPAVETLGSVTYICTDKTGTLTENRMHVERVACIDETRDALPPATEADTRWQRIGTALALNNDISASEAQAARGEPTELALYEAAAAAGFDKQALEQHTPRVREVPFDSTRKRMSTVHAQDDHLQVWVKGAPEAVIPHCSNALDAAGNAVSLDAKGLMHAAHELANEGFRVLALAERRLEQQRDLPDEAIEQELTLLALVALIDPPRAEARESVEACLRAGITPVMITGDHPGTARAIAERVGIAHDETQVMTGKQLAALPLDEFEQRVLDIRIYARVNPEQKTKIVRALQDRGQFVAMTGDGVNDAPALQNANIGVAMGKKGTDVAREASDLVLLDDNFATIVRAVREGRRIFDNVRKFIRYTMTSNSGEIWTLFLAPFLGLPLPLLPIHILWINLVTDGLPGLALSLEPTEPGTMRRAPRPPGESIFVSGGMWQHMLWMGLLIGGLSISAQAWAYEDGSENWQTMVFTVLVFSQLAHALVVRSETTSLWSLGLFSNRYLLGAIALTILLQLAVIYLPWLNPIFRTSPLAAHELAICFALPLIVLIAGETEKWLVRRGTLYGKPATGAA